MYIRPYITDAVLVAVAGNIKMQSRKLCTRQGVIAAGRQIGRVHFVPSVSTSVFCYVERMARC